MGATDRRGLRMLSRLAIVGAAVAFTVVGLAGPASAHAVLERSTPAADAVVKAPPRTITLTFDEPVLAASDAIKLYDDHLALVRLGDARTVPGRSTAVEAAVPERLREGTYTVTWRVTSADTHVVSGDFRFSVGKRTPLTGSPPDEENNPTVSVVAGLIRGLGYAGLVAGPGSLVVLAWLWPQGLALRRVRRFLMGGAALLAVVTVAGFLVQGALAAGGSISGAFTANAWHLGTRGHFGRAGLARLALLVALGWVAVASRLRWGGSRRSALAVSAAAAALALTWPYDGHAATGSIVPLAILADWVHVAAMATWLGGLTVLLAVVLRSPYPGGAALVVDRFSEWALAAVALIVATGIFAAWRNVRSFGALPATTYGLLLLAKIAVVVVVVAVGYLSWRFVRQATGSRAMTGLRRSVAAEAGVALVILGITAALTGTPQASEVYAPPFTQTATTDGMTVQVHVDRTRVGRSTLTVTTTRPSGSAQPIRQIAGTLSLVSPPVGPLTVRFHRAAVGRQQATVTFPDQGSWELRLDIRTSPVDGVAVAATIQIRD